MGTTTALVDLSAGLAREWADLQVRGAFLAVDLTTGQETGFAVDERVPLASVVKVPVALVVAELCARAELDPALLLTLRPGDRGPGPIGISALRHPVTMAVEDLLHQMVALSDNAAADALLDLVGLVRVRELLAAWDVDGIAVRHPLRRMYDYAYQAAGHDFAVATELAVEGWRPDGSHVIGSLDVSTANVGTVRGLVTLLGRVWRDEIASPSACRAVREAMRALPGSQRLGADLTADDVEIASKTGTFLNLRHDVGVVEQGPNRVAVAALTVSHRTARRQPDVDLAIGRAARLAVEALHRT